MKQISRMTLKSSMRRALLLLSALGTAGAMLAAPIIARLNAEITKVLSQAEVKQELLQQGAYAVTTTPEQA